MSEQPVAPPGWYPTEIPGEKKWWDGTQWTNDVPAAPLATRGFWRGNADVSLAAGIFCCIFALPMFGLALITPFSDPLGSIASGFAGLVIVGFGVIAFLNFAGLRRQAAQAQAQAPAPTQAPTPE